MADGAQHGQVGLRVRVGPRGGEVDALALRELADRLGLALAVGERPARPARVVAVDTSETEPTAPSKVSTIAISSAISCEAAVQMKIGRPASWCS
jgi:hypothetical protein